MSAVLDYRRKLYAIRDLPTLPAIAQKVLTLADDDDSGLEKLSAIITSDQSLSIRVLSMANSAYYGNRGKVGTIRHAVVVIGLNMLKQVALSALVCGTLGRRGKNRADFWKHSFGTAMAATTIANRTRLGDPDLCFMAGLLHDVGKLIIDAYFPNDPEMNHTEVGAWMAERWQLPQPLINAMAWHHSIEPEHLAEPIVACVHAANVCAKLALTQKGEDVAPEVLTALCLTSADFVAVVADVRNRKSQIDLFLV
jgi:putative nucleotidyltransferase with HDIG domain